ncbi:MAG: THUMP domain-containing protein [Nitrospirae bacterium]|nr:THUMP domain-containing protein [Nitrospirota bacterium]
MTTPHSNFFAPCPRGLEETLAQELLALDATYPHVTPGGVSFSAPFTLCYRLNLESRIASRFLWKVHSSPYHTEHDVYRLAYDLPWHTWFAITHRIKVKVSAVHCPLKSLDFVTLRIKDAICDRFVSEQGRRPSVDTRSPDIQIHAFLDQHHCTIYVDTSGDPLFKRGLRRATGLAPLRENLAAGILHLCGWTPQTPLLDPMCGSGTILMEAAQMACNIPPGFGRRFAFELFKNFDADQWTSIRSASRQQQVHPLSLSLFGFDKDAAVLQGARINLKAAGVEPHVQLTQQDFLESTAPSEPGLIITNPPYGIRTGSDEALLQLYPELGHVLKQQYVNWRAYFFTADRRLEKHIRLSTSRRTPLFNGSLECRLFEYHITAGSNRRPKPETSAAPATSLTKDTHVTNL